MGGTILILRVCGGLQVGKVKKIMVSNLKKANAFVRQKKYQDALDIYNQIEGNYPQESSIRTVIARSIEDCDPIEWTDPDELDENLTEQARSQVMWVAQRIPELGIPGHLSGIAACYDATPDWIPIYDRTNLNGYYLAIGTSGNQFKNAPVVGEMMADLIVGYRSWFRDGARSATIAQNLGSHQRNVG